MRRSSPFEKLLSLLLCAVLLSQGACTSNTLAALPGWADYLAPSYVPVPGGFVNAAGGNLLVSRMDLSIDTLLGTQTIDATYNSALGSWLWSFQAFYDGEVFADPSGLVLELGALPDGADVPGTAWVRIDADTLETKGGLRHEFDAAGRLAAVRWATLDYPRIRYLAAGGGAQLVMQQCTSPSICTPFFEIALRPDGRPEEVVDARTGRTAAYEYDAQGRLTRARTAKEVAEALPGTRFEYDGSLLTAMTNSEGERIEYTYQGRRTRTVVQIGEGNPTHRFQYGAKDPGHGDLYPTTYTNPLGGEVAMYFDAEQKLREQEFVATGELRTVEWNAKRITRLTAPSGESISFAYAGEDVASIADLTGNVVELNYAPGAVNLADPYARPITRIEDGLGLVEERTYDASGRLDTVTNGEGEAVELEHGPAALASFTNAAGLTWSFPFYGIHGHWLERQGATPDKRAFDPVGNATATSTGGQEGGVLTRGFDTDRNLTRLDVAATQAASIVSQGAVAIDRRSDGQVEYVSRPLGADHDFVYDALGRLAELREKADGAWQTTRFEYDAAGNLTARERPNGMREEWGHDAYGRVTQHRALRSGVLEGEAITTWQAGRVASVFDSTRGSAETYAYDAAGRLETILFGYGETLRFEYDLRSRRTAEIYSLPGQGEIRRIEYEHDLANRRIRITADGSEVLAEMVHADGRLELMRYGNGLERDYQYDPATGALAGTTTTDVASQVVETTSIARVARQNPVRFAVEVDKQTPLAQTREEYWFGVGGSLGDPERQIGRRVWHWTDGNGTHHEHAYDALSNQVDNSAGDVFDYDAEASRLLQASFAGTSETVTYTYDEAGFASSRNGLPLAWTATGRLAAHAGVAIEWDLDGRPIAISAAGVTRDFIYFGGAVDSDPATGALGGLDLGVVRIPFGSSERLYRHRDFRGNVSFLSDETGAVVAHYHYSAYRLEAAFGAEADHQSFAGGQEIGALMILGARIYDPAVGRFLSPDPVFQLLNQFTYTFGNPVFYWDPDGRHQTLAEAEAAYADVQGDLDRALGKLTVAAFVALYFPNPVTAVGFALTYWDAIAIAGKRARAWKKLQAARAKADADGISASGSGGPSIPEFGGGDGANPRNRAPSNRPPRYQDGVPGPFNTETAVAPIPEASCSPGTLQRLPGLPKVLGVVLVLQAALCVAIVRRRRAADIPDPV